MIDALKILWGSTGGRISVLIFGLIFAAGVSFAYVHGSQSGYKSGFTDGQKSRDKEVAELGATITALTKTINDERKAQDLKLKAVEKDAANAAVSTQQKLSQKIKERDVIIRNYQQQTPAVIKESCGLSIETVRAINLLIDSANEKAELPAPDSPAAPGSGPDNTDAKPGIAQPDSAVPRIGDDNA